MWCRKTCLPLKMLIHKSRRRTWPRSANSSSARRRKGVAPPFRGGIPSRAVDANDVLSARLHQGSGGGTSCARRRFTCARSRRRRAHPRGFHRRRGLRASRDRRRDLRRRGCVPTAATWPIDPNRRRRPDIAPSRSIPASRPVPLFVNPSKTASGGFASPRRVSPTSPRRRIHRTTSRRLSPAAAAHSPFFSHPPIPERRGLTDHHHPAPPDVLLRSRRARQEAHRHVHLPSRAPGRGQVHRQPRHGLHRRGVVRVSLFPPFLAPVSSPISSLPVVGPVSTLTRICVSYLLNSQGGRVPRRGRPRRHPRGV